MKEISSMQNLQIKNIVRLSTKAKERKRQGLFVIEGARELSLALCGGYRPESVFVCRQLFAATDYPEVLKQIDDSLVCEVSLPVFEKIAYREGSDGLLALAASRRHSLEELPIDENPFFILLEGVEKPGNLGAVLRTADAAKASGVIVCDPSTDVYNPNVIRSSIGCLFTVPIAVCRSEQAAQWLRKQGIRSYAAELTAAQSYCQTDFTRPSAIVMGTEADGLTSFWLEQADARIKIPMRGSIDSLNVSVSAAVIVFEAMRQRGFDQ